MRNIKAQFRFWIAAALLAATAACAPAITPTPLPEFTRTPVVATASPTHEPTATQEPSATPEAGYNFDLMQKHPKSYADFLADPSGYFEAPNPVEHPQEWADFLVQYGEYLGPQDQRDMNTDYQGGFIFNDPDMGVIIYAGTGSSRTITGEFDFFYFKYNNVLYPAYGFNVAERGFLQGTVVMVMQDFNNPNSRGSNFGTKAMAELSEGSFEFLQIRIMGRPYSTFTADMINLMAAGINAQEAGDRIWPGFAIILVAKK